MRWRLPDNQAPAPKFAPSAPVSRSYNITVVTIFIAAPLAIIAGLMQGPAIANRLGWFGRVLHRQAARSIHFLVLCYFVLFICVHVTLIFITGLRGNLNHMFAGVNDNGNAGFVIFGVAMVIVAIVWALATPLTLKYTRLVQKTGTFLTGWLMGLSEWWDPNNQFTQDAISPHFWPNGTMPNSDDFDALVREHFSGYSLRVYGLVASPRSFSLAELKASRCWSGWLQRGPRILWLPDADLTVANEEEFLKLKVTFAAGSR